MRIFVTILFIFCFGICFSQSIVNRSGQANTVSDARWQAQFNMFVPRFNDTTAANLQKGIDSAGAIIWTRNTNWFWGRQTTPTRTWVPFNAPSSQSGLIPSCGYPAGSHIVTWDSLLTFDISSGPFISCCDNIPRFFSAGAITLDSNTSEFQRYDLIVVDTSGYHAIKGTPSINPATPQADSCQQILTYVLINGHSNVPAFITPTNPLIIYDENYVGEWTIDSTNAVTVDTANTAFPVHLLKDMLVTNPSSFNLIRLKSSTVIDLNNYQALKFYVRKTSTASNVILITFFLDGVQETFPAQVQLPNGFNNLYQSYVVPLTSFLLLGSSKVDEINISFATPQTASFYIDWIQLQSGALIINPASGTSGTVKSVGMGDLDSLLHPSTANSNTTAFTTFTKFNVPANSALVNGTNATNPYYWGKIDLGTSIVTGLLPFTNLAVIPDGTYIGGIGGVNQPIPFINDTTFVKTPLVRTPGTGNNDTLSCPTCITSASQTLQQTFNTEVGGSVITKDDSVLNDTHSIKFLSTTLAGGSMIDVEVNSTAATGSTQKGINILLEGANTNSTESTYGVYSFNNHTTNGSFNYGVYGKATGGDLFNSGVYGETGSDNGYALYGLASSHGKGLGLNSNDNAIEASSNIGLAGLFTVQPSSTNSVVSVLNINRGSTGGAGANGIGGSIDFRNLNASSTFNTSNQIISTLTSATGGAETSQLIINGENTGTPANLFTLSGSGALQLNKYGVGTFTGTPTHSLQVDASGNVIEGVTQTPLFYSQPVNANNTGSNPESLATITVPANSLSANGVKVYGTADANFLTGSGTKQLEIICSDGINNTLISRTSTTADALHYFFSVVRQDATHALVSGYIMNAGAINDRLDPARVTWDFTQPMTVKMTVVQGSANDMTVRWLTANVFEP